MSDILLVVDCGTQSLRALVFGPDGRIVDKYKVEYEPYVSPRPGWAEQDPELYWQSLCKACESLKARLPDGFEGLKGVGVTTQRDSMVNVNKDGHPLRPTIIWLDQRKARRVHTPFAPLRLAYKIVGMDEALAKAQADGKCNWIMQNQTEIWDKTHKYLQLSGFLNHRLTGVFADSTASQIGHIPFDYKSMSWAPTGSLAWKLFPIEPEKLPTTVTPGETIGGVSGQASEETGIPEGVPVIACGSDKGCETLGMGVLDERMASLSFGTTATVQTTTAKYFEPLRFMPPYPAPIPGRYNPEVEIYRGYWMITWFKNEFAYKEVLEAHERGVAPEVVLDELLIEVPAGSMGLMVQPLWGPGLKQPAAKGAMIGFGEIHTKAHVYRAVIEGLAYALKDGLEKMQRAGKFKAQRLAVSGGASQSDEICRISANVFDLPLVRGATHETSGLGAAIVTSVGAGVHSSFEQAIDSMVQYDVVFEPNPREVAIYKELYSRVYGKMYNALKPLYEEIREITGYPER